MFVVENEGIFATPKLPIGLPVLPRVSATLTMHVKDTAVRKLQSALKCLKCFLTFTNIVVLPICFYSWAYQLLVPSIIMLSRVFYSTMHFSAKRGIAIACRLSVCLSVCDVGGSGSHRSEILETNCTDT